MSSSKESQDYLNPREKKLVASMHAVGIFGVMFGTLVLVTLIYDVSRVNLGGILFLVSALAALLIAKNVYDSHLVDTSAVTLRPATSPVSSQVYAQLYEKSPVPYFVIDATGDVVSSNIAAGRLLGQQQAVLLKQNMFRNISISSDEHKSFLIEKFHSGIGISDELVSLHKPDHSLVWALMSLFAFTNSSGEKQGLMTLVDITKQKKAEDAKNEFVSLASHQLRTPLAGMKWSAELLQMENEESLTERQHKYLNRLLESVARMGVLIDDFLRVSRFELGSFTPDYQTISLSKLVNNTLEEQRQTAANKQVTLSTDLDPNILDMVTDPNLLRMIVTNLVSNAIKYTESGGSVTFTTKLQDQSVLIVVSDTGMGIPDEDQSQIFTKLFRARNAVRNVPDGTGLGLYIVREAVSVLRGRVTFQSESGRGTTFEVGLPLSEPVETD
jgi:PAS domain S-box-containing protein